MKRENLSCNLHRYTLANGKCRYYVRKKIQGEELAKSFRTQTEAKKFLKNLNEYINTNWNCSFNTVRNLFFS